MKALRRAWLPLALTLLGACETPPDRPSPGGPISGATPPDELPDTGTPPGGASGVAPEVSAVPRASGPAESAAPADRASASPAVSTDVADSGVPSSPSPAARLRADALSETSGLAVSSRDGEVLWAINDGGHPAELHAMSRDGTPLGVWPVPVRNRDWEDLAAFRFDGLPRLLIADTGDNLRRRDEYALHLIDEPLARGPDAVPGATLTPWRTIRFRYEDGSHNVEAVGVDESGATAWLLVKEPLRDGETVDGGVYTLSLEATSAEGSPRLARRAVTLAAPVRGLVSRLAAALAGIDLDQPTAFDFAPGGRQACLLSYRQVRCFERADGEAWEEALARPGRTVASHGLEQAEALAISADGIVWFTSEGRGAPLRTLPLTR